MNVLIYNTDGVNPYAVEVAALLAREPGTRVVLLDAGNAEHPPPPEVTWRRVLPGNFASTSPVRQGASLLRGLTEASRAALRGDVVVVAWWRFPLEALVLAAVGALGARVVVVDHNPVPRFRESRAVRTARRALLRAGRVVVVHAQRLVSQVDPIAADKVAVCPHPPYSVTLPAPDDLGEPILPPDKHWVAFIGRLRRDKGIHLITELLSRVPEDRRRHLGLVLCGMGQVPAELREGVRSLGVTLVEYVSERPTPAHVLHRVLAAGPLVLAPYVAATQSGSVILALSMGCRVVAFDKGGIPDVLSPGGLVPLEDLDSFAAAVADGEGGGSLLPRSTWAEEAARAWVDAVAQAARPRQRMTPLAA